MFADPSELEGLPASERRRRIFERTKARYAEAGIALEEPEYLNLIELWISGSLAMTEAAKAWDAIRQSRGRRFGTD